MKFGMAECQPLFTIYYAPYPQNPSKIATTININLIVFGQPIGNFFIFQTLFKANLYSVTGLLWSCSSAFEFGYKIWKKMLCICLCLYIWLFVVGASRLSINGCETTIMTLIKCGETLMTLSSRPWFLHTQYSNTITELVFLITYVVVPALKYWGLTLWLINV